MKHTFTIENAFKFGWEKTKIHWASVLALGIISFLISLVTTIPMEIIKYTTLLPVLNGSGEIILNKAGEPEMSMTGLGAGLYGGLYIVGVILSLWISYNMYKIILKVIDGKDFKIGEIFHWDNKSLRNIGNYFLISLVYGIVIVVGFILLIIPGIYFGIKYFFAPYLAIDKGMGLSEAFKKSGEMSKGNMLKMIGFAFVSFAVVIVGLMALLVGVIPAIILTTFAGFYIYRKLADGHVAGEYGHTAKVVEEVKEITA